MKKLIIIVLVVACVCCVLGTTLTYANLKNGIENFTSSFDQIKKDIELLKFNFDALMAYDSTKTQTVQIVRHGDKDDFSVTFYTLMPDNSYQPEARIDNTPEKHIPKTVLKWLAHDGADSIFAAVLDLLRSAGSVVVTAIYTLIMLVADSVTIVYNMMESIFIILGLTS